MNHWHTVDQVAAGRLADLKREAAGGIRMRAAASAADRGPVGDPMASWRSHKLEIRRLMTELRAVLTLAYAHRRHDLRVLVAGWQPPGRSR